MWKLSLAPNFTLDMIRPSVDPKFWPGLMFSFTHVHQTCPPVPRYGGGLCDGVGVFMSWWVVNTKATPRHSEHRFARRSSGTRNEAHIVYNPWWGHNILINNHYAFRLSHLTQVLVVRIVLFGAFTLAWARFWSNSMLLVCAVGKTKLLGAGRGANVRTQRAMGIF